MGAEFSDLFQKIINKSEGSLIGNLLGLSGTQKKGICDEAMFTHLFIEKHIKVSLLGNKASSSS